MKHIYNGIIIAAIFVLSTTAARALGTGTVDIQSISVGSTGIVYLETSGAQINPAGCTESRYAIDTDLAGARHMYMLSLTARVSNLPLNISIHNTQCVIVGNKSFPRVFNMVTR